MASRPPPAAVVRSGRAQRGTDAAGGRVDGRAQRGTDAAGGRVGFLAVFVAVLLAVQASAAVTSREPTAEGERVAFTSGDEAVDVDVETALVPVRLVRLTPGAGTYTLTVERVLAEPAPPGRFLAAFALALSRGDAPVDVPAEVVSSLAGPEDADAVLLRLDAGLWRALPGGVPADAPALDRLRSATPALGTFALVVDEAAPVVEPVTFASAVRPGLRLRANVTDEVGLANVSFKVDGVDTGAVPVDGRLDVPGPQTEGVHAIVLEATDHAGHSTTRTWSVTVDATPPTVQLVGSARALSGVASDLGGGARIVAVALDGTPRPDATLDGASFRLDLDPPLSGDHAVVVDVVDAAGNSAAIDFPVVSFGASALDVAPPDDGVPAAADRTGLVLGALAAVALVGGGAYAVLRRRAPPPAADGGAQPGRYVVEKELGSGGVGTVYLARDELLGRRVVVKRIHARGIGAETRELIIREARAASLVQHPNLVTTYDVTRVDGQDALVMEYVAGGSLEAKIAEGPVPRERALALARGVLAGLSVLHRAGIVHRDLKPANILLADDGTPKLADFGVARAPGTVNLSAEGVQPGTLLYMSPEQAKGKPIDARSDLYAMGAVVYEAITGKHHLRDVARSEYAVRKAVAERDLDLTGLDPPLATFLARAMAKDPDDRFPTADAMAEALDALR